MKTKKFLITSCLATIGFLSADARAETPWYIGGNIGFPKYNKLCEGISPCDVDGSTSKIYGGYFFTPNLAIELGRLGMGDVPSGAHSPITDTYFKGQVISLDAAGEYPLGKYFSLLGRLGAAKITVERLGVSPSTDAKTKMQYSLGAGFGASMKVRVEWTQIQDVGDVYSLGLAYRF